MTRWMIRRRSQKKSEQVHPESWSRFRRWRHARPFAGSILMILAGILMIVGPVSLFQFAAMAGSLLWAGLLVGGLMLVMGLLAMLVPGYALMTGAIGFVLALVSLLTATVGGFGIGMILGIIGSALCVAWKPVVQPLRADDSSTNSTNSSAS